MTRQCDPVGAVEIAARLGVKRRTVDQWRQRDMGFPEPCWQVGGRPAWNYPDVERWHRERMVIRSAHILSVSMESEPKHDGPGTSVRQVEPRFKGKS